MVEFAILDCQSSMKWSLMSVAVTVAELVMIKIKAIVATETLMTTFMVISYISCRLDQTRVGIRN